MMLMPIGIINERHEPPVYYGVERPFVDTVIIPTTWFDVGAGVHGEVGRGWRYRAYVDGAAQRARSSPPTKAFAKAGRRAPKPTCGSVGGHRDAWSTSACRGLTLGASCWRGRSGFEFRRDSTCRCRSSRPTRAITRDRLELRGQFAQVWIDNAGAAERRARRSVGVNPNIARRAARLLRSKAATAFCRGSRLGDVGAFVRYENFDTQYRMPAGLRAAARSSIATRGWSAPPTGRIPTSP